MTYTLGISAYYHDSAVALLRDGEIVAAAQEERFSRIKGDERFPRMALRHCLDAACIDIGEIAHAAFYERPDLKFDRLLQSFRQGGSASWSVFKDSMPVWASQKLKVDDDIRQALGADFAGELSFFEHHESHAASAFYPSPFESAAIVVMDAVGEWATTSIGVGRDSELELLQDIRFPHSLGMLYSAFTYYTGFKVNSGEYKMMGLAPYGEARYEQEIRDHLLEIGDDGAIRLNMDYFDYVHGHTMTSSVFHDLFGGPPREPESAITSKERDIAASIQRVTEEVVLKTARHAQQLTGEASVVLAGGVALNCVANGRLRREGPFSDMWIQPASGDAGGALGAAYLAWHRMQRQPRRVHLPDAQSASYLGPAYTDDDIQVFLDAEGARYRRFDDEDALLAAVVEQMVDGKTIGWFHGRMEYGPRALGARSIIGDPRLPEMQQVMNLKIKFRESFRPFAPCVLAEHAHEVFALERGQDSPYMLTVAPLRQHLRTPLNQQQEQDLLDDDLCVRAAVPISELPAITHVDYSARVQTVDAQRHGRYYRLMRRFYEVTGCPVIVNTSFNIRGEPIVCSPRDAYQCFLATEMDCLVLENLLLLKSQQTLTVVDIESYRARYELD